MERHKPFLKYLRSVEDMPMPAGGKPYPKPPKGKGGIGGKGDSGKRSGGKRGGKKGGKVPGTFGFSEHAVLGFPIG